MAAMYAHRSPSRNDCCGAAVIWSAYCGFFAARSSALANESWSWDCVASVMFLPDSSIA